MSSIIAICGKGGVGKTAVSALLSRVLLEAGTRPLLLIDADPVGGLGGAIGERAPKTMGSVRHEILTAARGADDAAREKLAERVDYLVMEALLERDRYALLAMGRKLERGCFCPVNALLRSAIDLVVDSFSAVLIDAEAGVEQINREVTRRVSQVVAVTDGSARSLQTLALIAELVHPKPVAVVANRAAAPAADALPVGAMVHGAVPEDDELRRFDQEGRPLWELPDSNQALAAMRAVSSSLGLGGGP